MARAAAFTAEGAAVLDAAGAPNAALPVFGACAVLVLVLELALELAPTVEGGSRRRAGANAGPGARKAALEEGAGAINAAAADAGAGADDDMKALLSSDEAPADCGGGGGCSGCEGASTATAGAAAPASERVGSPLALLLEPKGLLRRLPWPLLWLRAESTSISTASLSPEAALTGPRGSVVNALGGERGAGMAATADEGK